jgi:hypothetical protein
MNTLSKIIVGFVAVTIILCLATAAGGFLLLRSGGQLIANHFETKPAKVADVASTIADYRVPAGFGAPYSAHLLGFSLVGYTGNDGHSHIYLAQLPKDFLLDQADFEKQLRQVTPGQGFDRPSDMTVVDQQRATIRGQSVTLLVSQGINSDGDPFREVTAMFEGKGGQVLVVYETPINHWNQAEVDTFLASIQ